MTKPVTDFEDWALALQHTIGGVDSLPPDQQAKALAVRDIQLERAEDLLKGLLIMEVRSPANRTQKVAER